jgi:hypothetical protein
MTLYFLIKYLHVLGAAAILGTGSGIAFFMLMAHRSRDPSFIAHGGNRRDRRPAVHADSGAVAAGHWRAGQMVRAIVPDQAAGDCEPRGVLDRIGIHRAGDILRRRRRATHLTPFAPALVAPVTIATSLMDMTIGVLIAFRRTCAAGLIAGIVASLGYMLGAAILTPDLWIEPLGALVKTGPAIVLMLVALLTLDNR